MATSSPTPEATAHEGGEIHPDVISALGNTPLVRLNHVTRGVRTPVVDFHVAAPAADLDAFAAAQADVAASGFVTQVRTSTADTRTAEVVLGDIEPAKEASA